MIEAEKYENLLQEVKYILADSSEFSEVCRSIVELLHEELPHYTWVGIYMVDGSDLVLEAWDGEGETEHAVIPIGRGVCGWAAGSGEIVNIPDVAEDNRYLECFPSTQSEIVVPIMKGSEVYGEIDVDSDRLSAFNELDEDFLSRVASLLAAEAEISGWPAYDLNAE